MALAWKFNHPPLSEEFLVKYVFLKVAVPLKE